MEKITSRENAKVKYACRLASSGAFRRTEGRSLAEGRKLCPELCRGAELETLFCTESDRCPLCQLLFRVDHFIRTVAQQELGLYIPLCTRDHKLCAQLLEQRCCFQ